MGNSFARFFGTLGDVFVWVGGQFGTALAIAAVAAVIVAAVAKSDRLASAGTVLIVAALVIGLALVPFGAVSGNDTIVRAAGYEVVSDDQPDYQLRPPLAVCSAKLASELGRLAGDPIVESVNYTYEDGTGRCTMVVDQRSIRRGLIGVVSWDYTNDRVDRCEANGIPAFKGWMSNSLRGDASSEKMRRSVQASDLIGRCGEFGAEIYAPARQNSGTGRYAYAQHAGMYVFAADGEGRTARTTFHASGDADTFGFSAPFYPASLAEKTIGQHRHADPSLGWFRRAGWICPSDVAVYEPVSYPGGSSLEETGVGLDDNVREFTLMRDDGSRLDAVTPMWRCGASESLVGVAVMQLDTFEAGRHNPVVLHERDTELLPLAQMAQEVAETPEVRVASRLKIHEVTPLTHDHWVALVGTERLVTFTATIPQSGRVTIGSSPFGDDGLDELDVDVDETSDAPAEVGRGDRSPSDGGELDELRDEVARLADEIAKLTEALTDER